MACGQANVAGGTTCDQIALQETVVAHVENDRSIESLEQGQPVEVERRIRTFDQRDLVIGQDRAGDVDGTRGKLLGSEDHFRIRRPRDDIERPQRLPLAPGGYAIQAEQLDILARQDRIAIRVRIRRGGANLEVVLAGEENLAVLEFHFDDRIGYTAHGHLVVREVPCEDGAVLIVVGRAVQSGLNVHDQVRDRPWLPLAVVTPAGIVTSPTISLVPKLTQRTKVTSSESTPLLEERLASICSVGIEASPSRCSFSDEYSIWNW